jgi:hypothetical protein
VTFETHHRERIGVRFSTLTGVYKGGSVADSHADPRGGGGR